MLRQVQPSSVARATFTLLLLMLGLAGCKPENQTCTDHNSCLAEGEMCVRGACCNPEDPDADQLECAPTLEAECGNGTIDPGETCDGDCSTSCDDDNRCTIDTLTGSPTSCDAACTHQDIESCTTEPEPEPEPEPKELCGNGTIDSGEICDGDCPSRCDDNDKCTADTLTGSATSCDAVCTHEDIESCTTEPDPEELCGNGKLDAGEACDSDCPTSCDDDDLCTTDATVGSANMCDVTCSNLAISGCTVLISGEQPPTSLLLNNSQLYWTTKSTRDALGNTNADGQLNNLTLNGQASIETIHSALRNPTNLLLSGDTLYVREQENPGFEITAITLGDNSVQNIASGRLKGGSFSVSDTLVFWTDESNVWSRALDGSGSPILILDVHDIRTYYDIETMYYHAGHLYLFQFDGDQYRIADGTRTRERISSGFSSASLVDESGIYTYNNVDADILFRTDFDGTGGQTLARNLFSDSAGQLSMWSDNNNIYVQKSEHGANSKTQMFRVPKEPGTSTKLAAIDGKGGDIAVDDNYIYWIVDNSILRIEK